MSQQHSSPAAGEAHTLYRQALHLLLESGEISCSLIQRRFLVGYVRAREAFERMEREGVIAVRGYTGKPTVDVQEYLKEVKDEV